MSENEPKERVLTAPEGEARGGEPEGDFESDAGDEAGDGPEGPEGGEGATAGEGGAPGSFDPFRRRRRRRRRRGRGRAPGAPGAGGEGAAAPANEPAPEARGRYAIPRVEAPVGAAMASQAKVTVKGIVRLHGDHSGMLVSPETFFGERGDPFLPKVLVESEDLEDGLLVEAEAVQRGGKGPMVQKILAIEGLEPTEYRGKYVQFHKGVSVDPDRRLRMETAADEVSGRVLDLVAPIGRGQRCLIVAPPKAGKTFLLKTMANAIAKNNPDVVIFMLLVDERPEEVTDMQRSITGEVIASPTRPERGAPHRGLRGLLRAGQAPRRDRQGRRDLLRLDHAHEPRLQQRAARQRHASSRAASTPARWRSPGASSAARATPRTAAR